MVPPMAASCTLVLTLTLTTSVSAQACAAGSAQEILGNWYCSEVKAITYTNFPGNGYYNKITGMDANTGQCTGEQYHYTGSLSPLNEELSLHVRGPTWLKQMAVYVPDGVSSSKKRDFAPTYIDRKEHGQEHGGHHHYLHNRHGKMRDVQARGQNKGGVGELVSASIDGKLATWINMYSGQGVATPVPSSSSVGSATEAVGTSALLSVSAKTAQASIAPSTAMPQSNIDTSLGSNGGGGWTREAYYNAAGGTADGVTVLNHFGGSGSGTAAGGSAFGASLSYASSNGQSGAASSQVLSNVMLEDDAEIIIMSDRSCDDGGCGYTRPGGVAYHGFSGSRKLFLLEFSMPLTGKSGFNGDMPAIWLHNAQIPLTSQYGTNPDCSCWTSGCGEFDLFEVLDAGDMRCKSTLHMAPAGGSSDWFLRPTQTTITAAVVFAGDNEVAAIRVLNGSQGFDAFLEETLVDGWVQEHSSMFKMGS